VIANRPWRGILGFGITATRGSFSDMEMRTVDMAHGGSAIARVDGKAFFVDGALPDELVAGEIELDKGSWGRVRLEAIIEPSPERVEPRCPHFQTCGGCQWQNGDYAAQLRWKESIVRGQLAHLGRLPDPPVRPIVAPGPPYGYRNRMDYRIRDGRPALYERRSRRLVPLTACPILHPNLADVFTNLGDLSGIRQLTLRTATATGRVLALITGSAPRQAATWGCDVAIVGDSRLEPIRGEPVLHEEVAGLSYRITGTTFFQNNTAGAAELVRLVTAASAAEATDTVLDAYAGGGLFAAAVGQSAGRVIAIERDRLAAADLHANLDRAGIDEYRIVPAATEDAIEHIDEYWQIAIADPPRRGLGGEGVDAVTAAEPRTVVYVSCDPASLARDTILLADAGYRLDWVTPVDMFPQTFHIEAVARYVLG
jgi:23S rRNA (uracil1939-C5)-methyltransferase